MTGRICYGVSAARLRSVVIKAPQVMRFGLIVSIWPDMPTGVAKLFAAYPKETRVKGQSIYVPRSWAVFVDEQVDA